MTTVSIDVDLNDVLSRLDDDEVRELLSDYGAPAFVGEGDAARREHIIERAYTVALNLPELPREIRDLFWLVHDRAL